MRNPTPALLAPALLVFAATPVHGQINVAWNDCFTQPGAAAYVNYACDGSRNGLPYKLVISFIAPANLPEYVGFQGVIEVGIFVPIDPPLVDWWRLAGGECRDGNLVFPAPLLGVGTGATGACQNPYLGAVTGGGYQYTSGVPAADRARLLVAFARDTPGPLVAGQQYVAGVLTLDTWGDVPAEGVTVCVGCCDPMQLLVQELTLYQNAGAPGGDVWVLNAPAIRQMVSWQNGQSPCPTPTRRTTWGSIKTTYR